MDDYLPHADDFEAPEDCIRAYNGHVAGCRLLEILAERGYVCAVPREIAMPLLNLPKDTFRATPDAATAGEWVALWERLK